MVADDRAGGSNGTAASRGRRVAPQRPGRHFFVLEFTSSIVGRVRSYFRRRSFVRAWTFTY